LLPSFSDQVVAAELQARLREFTLAFEAADDAGAQRAISRAEALLRRSTAHTANVTAFRFALARAQVLLDSVSTDASPPHAEELP
jgi:hypothetical protein